MNGEAKTKDKEQLNGSQMELIRTLHSTGIRRQTLIKAFAELEKQREDNGRRRAEEEQHTAAAVGQRVGAVHQVGQQNVPQGNNDPAFLLLHQLTTVAQHEHCELLEQRPRTLSISCTSAAEEAANATKRRRPTNSTGTCAPSQMLWQEQTTSCADSVHVFPASSSGRPIRSQRTPMKEIITLDNPAELDEFMARGEEQCIHAMRAFITQFSLRQTTVATMTGVSQPYISKLLNGNHRELSLRCRKNIYCWYLNCRRHPEKLAMFVQDPCTRLETTAEGELVPQRRERYVFRPVLLRVLEAFFQKCPFPDIAKRVEIANACNAHLQVDKRGAQLMPKEVVTPQVIANWFANKRKEMRRRMGGTGAELGRSRLNSLSTGRSNSPSSPPTAAHSEQRPIDQQGVDMAIQINDQPAESAPIAADLALLLPQLGASGPNLCPTTAPPLPQSLFQLSPPVDQLLHLLQTQPVANQLLLLQQLLVGTSPADGHYIKQDQQHLLMAICNQ